MRTEHEPFRGMAVLRHIVRLPCRDFQPMEVGIYFGSHDAPTRCGVACPYCRDLMIETRPTETPRRVVRVIRRMEHHAEVLSHAVPDSHRVLACESCRAAFTTPKDAESAMSEAR